MAQAMASGKFVAGVPAVVDGLLKSFGVNAGFDAQSVKPLLEAVNPRVDVLGHLIVAHADHAFAGGVLFRVAQQSHQLVSRTGAFVQLAVSVEPFKLADESRLAYMHAELTTPRLNSTQPQCMSALDSATGCRPTPRRSQPMSVGHHRPTGSV